jgi:hypothetical protein
MSQPLTTPFDITEIPYMPWVPEPLVWAGAAMIFLSLTALLLFLTRSKRTERKHGRLLLALLAELQSASAQNDSIHTERALRIARRVTALLVEPMCTQMSPGELRLSGQRATEESAQVLLRSLADLEELLYQPLAPGATTRITALISTISQAATALSMKGQIKGERP